MTDDQLQAVKQMSWPEFISKYGKMLVNSQITRQQYDKLLEIKNERSSPAPIPFNEQTTQSDVTNE